jgi:ubiquinone/menaquinone biosynthesis C-methylase UbiE
MTRQSWDNLAKGYAVKHGFGRGSLSYEKIMLRKFLSGCQSNLVLDVACGSGRHVRALKSLGFQAIGIDFSIGMLSEARNLGKDDYVLADARELPFASNRFDSCICMGNSIGSFAEPEAAINEMLRVSKNVLIEFRHETGRSGFLKRMFDKGYYEIRVWSIDEVAKMLKELHDSGVITSFRIEKSHPVGRGYFFYAVVEK